MDEETEMAELDGDTFTVPLVVSCISCKVLSKLHSDVSSSTFLASLLDGL